VETWYETGYVERLKHHNRLILVDPRGHGGSDKPHDPPAYALANFVDDILAVLDGLGIESADYFGYSMGGRIGFALSRAAPKRMRRFVIGGASPYGYNAALQRQFLDTLRAGLPGLLAFWERQQPVSPALRNRLLSNDIEALMALWTQRMNEPQGLDELIPRMTQPFLLIAGEEDWSYPEIRKCSEHLPNGRLVSLPGLNHFETIRRGDLVAPHILAFLEASGEEA
jgi:pimeloyl-ACP methyl ester carboxylesterase